jgi:hypothetical protein
MLVADVVLRRVVVTFLTKLLCLGSTHGTMVVGVSLIVQDRVALPGYSTKQQKKKKQKKSNWFCAFSIPDPLPYFASLVDQDNHFFFLVSRRGIVVENDRCRCPSSRHHCRHRQAGLQNGRLAASEGAGHSPSRSP